MRSCRICGKALEACILDYGETALANNFLTKAQLSQEEKSFPLNLFLCTNCGQVQLGDLVPPGDLFDNYLYLSSTQGFLPAHFKKLAEKIMASLDKPSFIVEVASNDGVFLKNFIGTEHTILGVEPAANVAEIAKKIGVRSMVAYFSKKTATKIKEENGWADIMMGANVFAHVPDIKDFVKGVELLLSPEGTAIFESPYLVDFIEGTLFDTVYHEHVLYLSLKPLATLFAEVGMEIVDAERTKMHGGSIRFYVKHRGAQKPAPVVQELLELEKSLKLDKKEGWKEFSHRVHALKKELRALIEKIKGEGKTIAAYAATAKGNTLLNYVDIGRGTVMFIADKNPLKQDHYSPGKHIPIVSPEVIDEKKPDYLLILAWNIADEIMEQLDGFKKRGGQFIIPLPSLRVI
ncbi:MAG: class I SAM-dependent methyltransferase [Nanoarchaeota archaeon]